MAKLTKTIIGNLHCRSGAGAGRLGSGKPLTRAARMACLAALAALAACGPDGSSSSGSGTAVTPTPAASPTPAPSASLAAAPFGLSTSREFDILGMDLVYSATAPATLVSASATLAHLRWNAAASAYEILLPGHDWTALTDFKQNSSASGSTGATTRTVYTGQVTYAGAAPFTVWLYFSPLLDSSGEFVIGGSQFILGAFGLGTAAGNVPTTGSKTYPLTDLYNTLVDEVFAKGTLTADFAQAKLGGTITVSSGGSVLYTLEQVSFTPGSPTFTARLTAPGAPADGVVSGRFYGANAGNVALAIKAYTRSAAGVWSSDPVVVMQMGPLG